MKSYWKAIGIATLAAGVLYYPVMRLVKYLSDEKGNSAEEPEHETIRVKKFSPAYRGKKDHHQRHNHEGRFDQGMA